MKQILLVVLILSLCGCSSQQTLQQTSWCYDRDSGSYLSDYCVNKRIREAREAREEQNNSIPWYWVFVLFFGFTNAGETPSPAGENLTIKNNAYGLGVHSDQYGRPVDLKPAYNGDGNTSGSYIQKQDAYGPGIHMDQFGRPVQAVPRY